LMRPLRKEARSWRGGIDQRPAAAGERWRRRVVGSGGEEEGGPLRRRAMRMILEGGLSSPAIDAEMSD
jgi:hypothetical protein